MGKLLLTWLATAVSLLVASFLIPGFEVSGLGSALIASVVIGLVNGTVGFLLKVLTFPVTFITFGLFLLVINALMIMLAAQFVSGFTVSGFWAAFFGSIVVSIVGSILRPNPAQKKD
jgi:putative membrane protein